MEFELNILTILSLFYIVSSGSTSDVLLQNSINFVMQSTVTLKSGEEVRTSLQETVMPALKNLLKTNPVAFMEMVELCRDQDHEPFGDTLETLQQKNLVKPTGHVRPEVREIVLNAVEGEGLDMQIVSPLADDQRGDDIATEKMRELDDYEFFLKVRRVADKIFNFVRNSGLDISMQDRRRERVNPVYNQTADGMFLEMSYGHPAKLWTPWGTWGFTGSASGPWIKNPADEFLEEEFGIITHQERKNTKAGPIGPVYALHTLGSESLPEPRELESDAYDDSKAVREAWKDLYGQYLRNERS